MKNNDKGFTIPELLVTIILTGIFSAIIIMFVFNYWRSSYQLQGDLDSAVTRMNASDFIREYIGNSSGLIIQNGIPDPHPSVVDTSIASGNYWQPIHAIPETKNVSGNGSTPLIYFKKYSVNTSGNVVMNGTSPYEDEFILYLDNSSKSMKLRSLANSSAASNKLITSCATAYVTASCPADKEIIGDLSSVALRYFSRSGNLIDHASSTDPSTGEYIGPDFPTVEVAEMTLNISKKVVFQKGDSVINSTIIRVALRNT